MLPPVNALAEGPPSGKVRHQGASNPSAKIVSSNETVTVAVPRLESVSPSHAANVKVSVPEKP